MKTEATHLRRRELLARLAAAACGIGLFGAMPAHSQSVQVSVVFSPSEARLIRDFFAVLIEDEKKGKGKGKGKSGGGVPPGLAKKDELPPGLARQIKKNGRLPPGIEKQALPGDLVRRLPAVRAGFERVIVNRQVLLIEQATNVIHDVLVIADIPDG